MRTTLTTGLTLALVAGLGAGAVLAQTATETPDAGTAVPEAPVEPAQAAPEEMGIGMEMGGVPGLLPLALYDTDGDGLIARDEIEAARTARFAEADADGDGALSPAEVVAMEEAIRQEMQTARAEAQVGRMDDNGDGLLQAEELEERLPPLAPVFDQLDADGDEAISQEELAAARDGRGEGRDGFGRGGHGRGGRGPRGEGGFGGGWGFGLFGG